MLPWKWMKLRNSSPGLSSLTRRINLISIRSFQLKALILKMNGKFKAFLQYAVMLLFTGGLLWLSLRSLNVEDENKGAFIWETWQKADKGYMILMVGIVMLSHILRALRWQILLAPT